MPPAQRPPYATPSALRRALTDRLRALAAPHGPWLLADLRHRRAPHRRRRRLPRRQARSRRARPARGRRDRRRGLVPLRGGPSNHRARRRRRKSAAGACLRRDRPLGSLPCRPGSRGGPHDGHPRRGTATHRGRPARHLPEQMPRLPPGRPHRRQDVRTSRAPMDPASGPRPDTRTSSTWWSSSVTWKSTPLRSNSRCDRKCSVGGSSCPNGSTPRTAGCGSSGMPPRRDGLVGPWPRHWTRLSASSDRSSIRCCNSRPPVRGTQDSVDGEERIIQTQTMIGCLLDRPDHDGAQHETTPHSGAGMPASWQTTRRPSGPPGQCRASPSGPAWRATDLSAIAMTMASSA